jgi:hypothetical protein
MKVVYHPALAVTNVVIANAVKQSIAVFQKLDRHAKLAMTVVGGLPRFAHDH